MSTMSIVQIVAVVFIVLGVLGLVFGGFSYPEETHETTIGPLELKVQEKETVNIPVWAGVGSIAVGSVLLLCSSRMS